MKQIEIDINDYRELFTQDKLVIDKRNTIIFGKNGTGKSTIARLFQEQAKDYQVELFNGFEGVLGENNELNAILLGEYNLEIEKQIQEYKKTISNLEEELLNKQNNIEQPKEGEKNLWLKHEKINNSVIKQKDKIKKALSNAASNIKKDNRRVVDVNYNIGDIKKDISISNKLDKSEVSVLEKVLHTEIKHANNIPIVQFDLKERLKTLNDILNKFVDEPVKIDRLENDENKKKFAREGLEIHKVGDQCAFCSNILILETYNELKRYFENQDVLKFESQIKTYINEIQDDINVVNNIKIDKSEFYPQFKENIEDLTSRIETDLDFYKDVLKNMNVSLNDKLNNMFQQSKMLMINVNRNLNDTLTEYNEIVEKNNSSNLKAEIEDAKLKLKNHLVYLELEKSDYYVENALLRKLEEDLKGINLELKNESEKVNKLREDIKLNYSEIDFLKTKTQSETKLEININKVLENYVFFKLETVKGEKSYYQIKCLKTGEIRSITEISTGEKNIIAFLYFLEKLNEIKEEGSSGPKLIIFDDPVNSNDDTMQYIIMEKLLILMNEHNKDDNSNGNVLVILTHNSNFYLNIKYNLNYKKTNVLRLSKRQKEIEIKKIENKSEDIQTGYEALWRDLGSLYKSTEIQNNMLCNAIRRIIGTYTLFNNIDRSDFFAQVIGAKKFFDVFSHEYLDVEADYDSHTKEEILLLMKECFYNNGQAKHFDEFIKIAGISNEDLTGIDNA